LFRYEDENGEYQKIDSSDVNNYLRRITGTEFTAKDFRTWAGTVYAAIGLEEAATTSSPRKTKSTILRVIEQVSDLLNNTPAVCRKYYIHPELIEAFLEGEMPRLTTKRQIASRRKIRGLSCDESAVLMFLKELLERRQPNKKVA
jgi:DNA topoisomerase-1